jgi:hypothetical protein
VALPYRGQSSFSSLAAFVSGAINFQGFMERSVVAPLLGGATIFPMGKVAVRVAAPKHWASVVSVGAEVSASTPMVSVRRGNYGPKRHKSSYEGSEYNNVAGLNSHGLFLLRPAALNVW